MLPKEHIKQLYITILIPIISTIYSGSISAQIINNEQSHFSIKWKHIDTKNYQLIFPQPFTDQAIILSQNMDSILKLSATDLRVTPGKISLILESNHIDQNGFVQLAPRKSEVYPIQSGLASNQQWLPNLVLHEMRHVAQFDKLTHSYKKPFWEQLGLALFGIHVPSWYFEGDAVEIETRFSDGGRGRLPSWEMPIRAQIQSHKNHSFDKYLMGSYRDLIPSYYTIGYFMNIKLSHDLGADYKAPLLDDLKKHPLRPYNFRRSLQTTTGETPRSLFEKTIWDLTQHWGRDLSKIDQDKETQVFYPKDKYPTSYLLPQMDVAENTYGILQSPQKTNQLVRLNNEEIKRIVYLGRQLMPYYHLRGNEIVWDEYRKDARFGKQTFQVINIYNLSTRQQRTFDHKQKYYTPVLHPIRAEILVVSIGHTSSPSFLILDSNDGSLIDSIPAPDGLHILQPAYSDNGEKIVCIAISNEGTSLLEYDSRAQEFSVLLDWTSQQLEKPIYFGKNIIYKAHYEGKDQIFQLEPNGRVSQLTEAAHGAFNPYVARNDSILYNNYTTRGYQVSKIAIDNPNKKVIRPEKMHNHYFENSLKDKYAYKYNTDTIETPIVKDYSSISHLFNFHSLSISSNNFDNFDNFKPGLFWYANDLLNTSQIKLGYERDLEINKGSYSAELLYQRYTPIFALQYINRGQIGHASFENRPDSSLTLHWREHVFNADIRIPFSIYRQNYIYSYGFNWNTSYVKRYDLNVNNLKNFDGELNFPMSYQIYLTRNSRRSPMDLTPRWGQSISLTYRHFPLDKNVTGNILSVRTNFYFPGILLNHGLQARFAAQTGQGRYAFLNDIPLINGYSHIPLAKVNNTLMLNYRLPLLYPDWSLGSVAYIKRIHGMLFSDYQNIDFKKRMGPQSFGLGISVDTHFFRYPIPSFTLDSRLIIINSKLASRKVIPNFSISYSY